MFILLVSFSCVVRWNKTLAGSFVCTFCCVSYLLGEIGSVNCGLLLKQFVLLKYLMILFSIFESGWLERIMSSSLILKSWNWCIL